MKKVYCLPTKPFLFICFLFFTSVNVSAQYKLKGIQMGANGIAFNYPNSYQAGTALRATLGVLLTDHLVIGVQPFYGRVWSGSHIITGTGTGIYSRLYGLNGRFQVFGEFSYSRGKLSYTAADPTFSRHYSEKYAGSKGEYVLFGMGASFFINKRSSFAIELSLPIVYMRNRVYRDTNDYQRFTPMIGMQYFFKGVSTNL